MVKADFFNKCAIAILCVGVIFVIVSLFLSGGLKVEFLLYTVLFAGVFKFFATVVEHLASLSIMLEQCLKILNNDKQ